MSVGKWYRTGVTVNQLNTNKYCTINKISLVCFLECIKGCMMTWLDKLGTYLKELLGQDISIAPLGEDETKGLPLYLAKKYTPYRVALFGRQVIVLQKQGEEADTPSRILTDVLKLREHFECDVAIALDAPASWERKRLIEKGVPFVVPGRQLFLPMLLIDLREHFPRGSAPAPERLSRAAQQTVLRQILKGDVEHRPMAAVATLLGYSPMMMTKIRSELAALGLCTEENRGRIRGMVFPQSSKQLWLNAAPKMRSPVYRQHYFVGSHSGMQLAGISALATRSTLQADTIVSAAVWKKRYEPAIRENMLTEIETKDDADLIIEEWYYDPQRLSDTGEVDPLSLYLSLRNDPDERIQIAVEELLETVSWLEE